MAFKRTITLREAVELWQILPEKLQVNLLNFEVRAAKALKSIFRESFYLHRFNASGQPAWKPHSPNWIRHSKYEPHDLLVETGNLKRSIKAEIGYPKSSVRSVTIYSDPNELMSSKRQYGRNFYYAAIHNEGNATTPRRQFIGYSDVAISRLNALAHRYLFDGFPK